jgi:hypothetical protein
MKLVSNLQPISEIAVSRKAMGYDLPRGAFCKRTINFLVAESKGTAESPDTEQVSQSSFPSS